ncbi:MAG: diguanylate cyclase [Magnetococcus sp. DMHC-6]
MFKYRFLRISFIFSILIAVFLPIHSYYITYPAFRGLLTHNTEDYAIQVAQYMASWMDIVQNPQGVKSLAMTSEFLDKSKQILKDFNIIKYRLFSPSGEILHSSESKEIGDINSFDYFHQIVAKGTPYSKTVAKKSKTLEHESFTMDVVETYVPIMHQGNFIGAFEIYIEITRQKKALEEVVFHSSVVLFVIGGIFLLAIFLIRRSVVLKISHIIEAMMRISKGDLQHQIPVSGQDELSDMARIFNQMAEQVQRSHTGLQQEENKLRTILLSALEGIVVTDPNQRVVLVNPSASRLLGKTEEQIKNEGFLNLTDDATFMERYLQTGGVGMPNILFFNNRVLNFHASTITDHSGKPVGSAALYRDITEEKKLERQLRELSLTDGLTGLLNRRRLDELLVSECDRARRYGQGFGVLLFDVDHFKKFNDQYGHDQGDRVLQAIAKAMQDHFRQVDHCCRYGGEEFTILMPNTLVPGILEAAERFREKVQQLVIDGLQVTISIGVAIFDPKLDGKNSETLLKRADQALYRAKKEGRNRVCHTIDVSEK